MILYHATSIDNIESIKKEGLLPMFGCVYLTDTLESAIKWGTSRGGFRMEREIPPSILASKDPDIQKLIQSYKPVNQIAVIEVKVLKRLIHPGTDHSPLMNIMFGVGASLVSYKPIPPSRIKKINIIDLKKISK